jgi:GT2 family glycosyltransferase
VPVRPVRFSVVIPTLRRQEALARALASLTECVPRADEVIVVDGDPDRSAEAVTAAFSTNGKPHVRYLASDASGTRQRNVGIQAAAGDVVVFSDDDVRLRPSVFAELATAYADPTVVGATGRVLEPRSRRFGGRESRLRRWLLPGGPQGSFTRFGYPRYLTDVDEERDVEAMPGCFMSARRAAALHVGFDERLTGYSLAEDEDFSCRLARLGRIRYLPHAVVEHDKQGFSSHDPRAFGRLVVVNRTYLFRKNFHQTPLARAQFALFLFLQLAHRLVNGDRAGARGLLEGMAEVWRPR